MQGTIRRWAVLAATAAIAVGMLPTLPAAALADAVRTAHLDAAPSAAPAAASVAPRPGSDVPAAADGQTLDALIPTAQSLAAVGSALPADPVDAAESLVDDIFGSDDAVAVAATGELLRRAGLPLVSAAGPVIAVPGSATIINLPVDVELLPTLTRAVRSGIVYTPQQLSDTLTFAGVTTSSFSAAEIVGILAAWGKSPGAPAESAAAGAAVRALARARGELLVPSALPDEKTLATLAGDPGSLTAQQQSLLSAPGRLSGLDPLTVFLFVAHAAGEVVGPVVAAGTGTITTATTGPTGLRRGAPSTLCGSLSKVTDTQKAIEKKIFIEQIKESADQVGEGLGEQIGKGFDAYDKGADALTTLLLLMGAKLQLVTSPGATHFRHTSGDPSRDVLFVANATFSGPLAAKRLKCWAFAGMDLPPDGPMDGFRVRWEIFGSLPVLQTKHDDSDKLLDGEVTKDGVSTLQMYPRTETSPPKDGADQPQATIDEIVVASLDKDDFPFKFSDLVGVVTGPAEAPFSKAWDIGVAWMQKVGLPSQRLKYPVTYHTNSPYVIAATTKLNGFGLGVVTLDADLYSCRGPAGPWQGSVKLTGTLDPVAIAAAKLLGGTVDQTSGAVSLPVSFTLNSKSAQDQTVPLFKDVDLVINLDPDAIETNENPMTVGDVYDRLGNRAVVGDGSYISGGVDMRSLIDSTASMFLSGADFKVVGVMRDSRCPGASYWDDKFDDN